VYFIFRPLTFVAVRVVLNRPGMTGALIDGMLRFTAWTGSLASAAIRAAVSSNVRPGIQELCSWMRPAPKSNGSAGVTPSSLTTLSTAVVMSADLI
jgi:hypothetical protein